VVIDPNRVRHTRQLRGKYRGKFRGTVLKPKLGTHQGRRAARRHKRDIWRKRKIGFNVARGFKIKLAQAHLERFRRVAARPKVDVTLRLHRRVQQDRLPGRLSRLRKLRCVNAVGQKRERYRAGQCNQFEPAALAVANIINDDRNARALGQCAQRQQQKSQQPAPFHRLRTPLERAAINPSKTCSAASSA
jgi:hypothetical protein